MPDDGVVHDVVVLGGGPGGYAAAFRAAVRGLTVALVETDKVGGTCLHRGCIPSKALLYVGELLAELREADKLGLDVELRGIDLDGLRGFRDRVVRTLHTGLQGLVNTRTAAFVEGTGTILEPGVVQVALRGGGAERVRGRNIVIATGSKPRALPGIPIDGEVVLTSDEALRVDRLPQRALIVGAGAIGVEFATFWQAVGAEVTIVEALDRVLPLEDEESSAALQKAFTRRGIGVYTSAMVEKVAVTDGTARVEVTVGDHSKEFEVDTVLIAVGRGPNTEFIGAKPLGVVDQKGFVVADQFGKTSADGVWGVGDVLPTLALAHAAFAEGFVVADTIAGVETQAVDYAQVPRVTYSRPEVASVGLTEAEAIARGETVECARYSLRANAKGIIARSDGHVKVVARAGDGDVLGVHVVGPHATDLIAEASLATAWGAAPSELARIVHPHPTLSEALGEAFLASAGLPFHGH